jgi:chromosome segregation ATPase
MNDNDATPDTETRPCAHCGRPVPQRASAGRPFRYCRDNDGECQRASRNSRMRHRSSPGLAGEVARTWEIVDRLDQLVGTLSEALHSELSPAGVERRLAELQAETSGRIAAAHTERDDARRDAERAGTAAATAQQLSAAAAAERDEARHQAEESDRRAKAATESATQAAADRDEAHRETTRAVALRERAESERDAARAELAGAREAARAELADLRETARADLAATRDELATAQAELQQARRERDTIERDLATAVHEAQSAAARAEQLRHTVDELTTARRDLNDHLTAAQKTTAAVREEAATAAAELLRLRQALSGATAERDSLRRAHEDLTRAADQDRTDLERRLTAARTEAETAQARAAQLTAQVSDLASALASLGGTRPAATPAQQSRAATAG